MAYEINVEVIDLKKCVAIKNDKKATNDIFIEKYFKKSIKASVINVTFFKFGSRKKSAKGITEITDAAITKASNNKYDKR